MTHGKWIWWPSILLSLVIWSSGGVAQDYPELFQDVDLLTFDLSEAQGRAVFQKRQDPSVQNVRVVRINLQAMKEADGFRLRLVGDSSESLETMRVETRTESSYSWFGRSEADDSDAVLAVNGDRVSGSVRSKSGLFRIQPLGDGLHAVLEVDETQFPEDHPPEAYEELEEEFERDSSLRERQPILAAESDAMCGEISLIVAYTKAAAIEAGDIDGMIQLAIDETNEIYRRSQIPLRVTLAHSYLTDYNETSSMTIDRNRLRAKGDNHLEEIHGLRDKHRADVGILIRRRGDGCGIAGAILADESNAFAVVGQNCATGYYSFGHEIGHLQGARHNPEADPTNLPGFEDAHGHYSEVVGKRTMMSYACENVSCTRVKNISHPDIYWEVGAPTGIAGERNNSRVIRDTACRVTGFR